MVAHMVHTSIPLQGENPARCKEGIVKELWTEFQSRRTVSTYTCSNEIVNVFSIFECLSAYMVETVSFDQLCTLFALAVFMPYFECTLS